MIIKVLFGGKTRFVSIPKGCLDNTDDIKKGFLEWIYNNPKKYLKKAHKGHYGYCFSEKDFLLYVNDVLLINHYEKALFVDTTDGPFLTISF